MKVFKITKTDAKIKMLRQDTASMFIMLIALIIIVAAQSMEGVDYTLGIIGSLILCAVTLASALITALCNNEIKALNVMGWPLWKYELEDKDE